MTFSRQREEIARLARSLFDRGLTFGSTGNISVRLDDGWLMTPTGSSFGDLDPARISHLDVNGKLLDGDAPTKEAFLHRAMYDRRGKAGAIVHLHASHSTAVSCMAGLNPSSVLPPLTAYFVMRIGTLPLIPYFPPGDLDLADAVREMASEHHAVLLANHGPVVAGKSLKDAVYATEELEETAKLFLMLQGHSAAPLTPEQVKTLQVRFPVET